MSSDLTETLATAIITNAAISATVDEGLITERLANSLVSINKGDEAEQTDDVSDADVVITKYWQALGKDERLNKVKAFLRKISKAHLNSRDLKPWLKDLNVGDQENPYGTKYGVTKTFDRSAHHFGHSPNEETELDEAKSGHVWDTMSGLVSVKVHKVEPDPNYPDHPGLRKAHIEVTSRNHKIYKKGERHETLASHIHPKSAIHRRSGIYRIWPHDPVGESKAIPNIDICQGLQEGYSNVNRYVEHINKNPFSLLSEPISKSSPASELKSVWRQKAAQQKLFGEQIDPRHHHRKPK